MDYTLTNFGPGDEQNDYFRLLLEVSLFYGNLNYVLVPPYALCDDLYKMSSYPDNLDIPLYTLILYNHGMYLKVEYSSENKRDVLYYYLTI